LGLMEKSLPKTCAAKTSTLNWLNFLGRYRVVRGE
jgi:hypothetical protein